MTGQIPLTPPSLIPSTRNNHAQYNIGQGDSGCTQIQGPHFALQARRSLSCFRYHVLSLNYPTKVRIFLEIIILTDESLKSTELFPHVHWLHTQEVVKVYMQLTYLCHGLHFYADVLFQLAGSDVTREYQGHIVGINQLQESRALNLSTGRLFELISRKIYLCKKRLLVLLSVVHCR